MRLTITNFNCKTKDKQTRVEALRPLRPSNTNWSQGKGRGPVNKYPTWSNYFLQI